jgi:hypothetical protein
MTMMERAAKKNNNSSKFQLWQPESHPIPLINIILEAKDF